MIADDSIRPLRDDDFEQVDALLTASNIRQKRTADFLRWRYRQNPQWQYTIDGLFEGEELQAFLIHRDTVLRGLRSLAIADVGVRRGKDAALRQLFRQVSATCHDRGVGVAAAFLTRSHPAYRSLRRCGFIRGPHRFNLLLQVFDDSLRHVTAETWSLSWGDTDHL